MTPYLILDNELETALKFAAERGVDVKLKNVLIVTKDIERAKAFYHDLFGLEMAT